MVALESEVSELTQELLCQTEQLSRLSEEKEAEGKEASMMLDKLRDELEEARDEVEIYRESVSALKATGLSEAAESEMMLLEKAIGEKDGEIRRESTALKGKDREIDGLRVALDAKQKELDAVRLQLAFQETEAAAAIELMALSFASP